MTKISLRLTSSLLGLAGALTIHAAPAWAQPVEPAGDSGAADEAQADYGGADNVILVTAQRREENLQQVPIAVAAVGSEALANAGIESTAELSSIVPAVQSTHSGPTGLFFVRGVGTTNAAAGEEGANAVYVDGVYLPDLFQAVSNFNNIERIEVLKGPQGTLFGRNATGGLIHIITRDPGDEFTIKGEAGYANYDTLSGKLYAAAPLGEGLAADIALTGLKQHDGWGDNVTLGKDVRKTEYWGIRSKLVLEPSDAVKFTLAGDYFDTTDSKAVTSRLLEEAPGLNINPLAPPPTAPKDGQDTKADGFSQTRQENWGVSLTSEFTFDVATLTSITSYRENDHRSLFDADAFESPLVFLDYASGSTAFQEELRLASAKSDPFGWQVGFFYLKSKATQDQAQRGLAYQLKSLQGLDIDGVMKTDSMALFGELNYYLTPNTEIIGGIRYTADDRKFDGTQVPILLGGAAGPASGQKDKLSYEEITWRVALRHEFSPDLNVYASVNRGFKAGTFSLQNPTAAPVDPQYITAYEVGLKSQLFDKRLRLNVSAYHYDISDYQVRSAAVANPGSLVLLNAAEVDVDGIDVDFDATLTPNLHLFGGFTLLDSRFASFDNAPFVYPLVATCAFPGTKKPGQAVGAPIGGLLTNCLGDASGHDTPLAPEFTASIGATYVMPVGDEGELRASALFNHNSGFNFEFDDFLQQDDFQTLNLSLEYRPNAHWGIELWGKNVTDEEYYSSKLSVQTGPIGTQAAPATYGVNVKFDY